MCWLVRTPIRKVLRRLAQRLNVKMYKIRVVKCELSVYAVVDFEGAQGACPPPPFFLSTKLFKIT
jgi:hypothetical protein